MIRLEDLTVGYGSRMLIEHADCEFAAGRLVALIGRNGSGKSTLLRALSGLSHPVGGKVLIGGSDIERMPAAERARTVAFVTTERVRIANMRCRDIVALGRAPYTDWIGRLSSKDAEAVDEALHTVGMEAYADRTMDKMSDGECQRVMVARALAQDTPAILLDEPTSFLDMPNRYQMCMLLRRLCHEQGKCIVFSTHELDIALDLCDDIALVDSPRLIALPAREMENAGHISRLFSASGFDPLAGRSRCASQG